MVLSIRKIILFFIKPFFKWFGALPPFLKKPGKMSESDYQAIARIISPADVILCRKDYMPSNIIIPGFFKHVGLYAGPGVGVVEARGNGVVATPLKDLILRYDHVAVVRCDNINDLEKIKVVNAGVECIGEDYDFYFCPQNDDYYCAELVWECYNRVLDNFDFKRRFVLGVATVIPQDFYDAKRKWTKIYKDQS